MGLLGFGFNGKVGGGAVCAIDVGAFNLVQELAGVGGEALDVAALAFGVNRVKRQGRLAGTAKAGDEG